ncbi:BTS1 [Candida pseudojiufengensis]|uniref:BTS1 n=1 Tax=Candida pseudojiufengensis TaxID=497109 RepID=UPI002224E80F|nr:BTS1 [Candida pseudojiufengensis]KAI5964269.1 BTS1 [Candida pseudojiufengensis]
MAPHSQIDEVRVKFIYLDLPTDLQNKIEAPFTYLNSIPSNHGKVRSKFLNAFNEEFFQIRNEKILNYLDELISILHNASLLIDDIEDNSQCRRGFPASYKKFGMPLTLNCGNLYYFKAFEFIDKISKEVAIETNRHVTEENYVPEKDEKPSLTTKLYRILIEEMNYLHNGQGSDIYWRDFLPDLKKLPSVVDYYEMVNGKTSGLFRLACKFMAVLRSGGCSKSFFDKIETLANIVGIIYQIRDDYLNLYDSNYSVSKGLAGEDLIEGKLSFPILIHLLDYEKQSLLNDDSNGSRKKLKTEKPTKLSTARSRSHVKDLLYNYRTVEERMKQQELIQLAIEQLHEDETFSKIRSHMTSLRDQFEECQLELHGEKDFKWPIKEDTDLMKIVHSLTNL